MAPCRMRQTPGFRQASRRAPWLAVALLWLPLVPATVARAQTYRPADMLDDTRAMVWREVGQRGAADTYRRNLQRAYLAQAHHLLHDATSKHWTPPDSGNLRVTSNDDPPLNADLHVAQSDIRPLLRDQLRLLRGELREALDAGVSDRMTRIHYEDALERIAKAIAS